MLGLKAQKQDGKVVDVYKKAVKHAVSNAVRAFLTQVMNCSDDGTEDNPRCRYYLIDG